MKIDALWWILINFDEFVKRTTAVFDAHGDLPEWYKELLLVELVNTGVNTFPVAAEVLNRVLFEKVSKPVVEIAFLFQVVVDTWFHDIFELTNPGLIKVWGLIQLRFKILGHRFHLLRLDLSDLKLTLATC